MFRKYFATALFEVVVAGMIGYSDRARGIRHESGESSPTEEDIWIWDISDWE